MSQKTMPENLRALDGKTVEFISDVMPIKVEKLADKKYRFETIGSIANVLNSNNRIIPFVVQRDGVQDWFDKKWQLTAYLGHPVDGDPRGKEEDLAGIPEIVSLKDTGETVVNIRLIETDKGDKVKALFDEGVELGTSQRALGVQSVREDEQGNYYIVVDKIVKILGYDFCYLDSAAAGERTRLRLLDTVELGKILNSKRIEDTYQEEDGVMDAKELMEQNKRLIESVTALVDTIQKQMQAKAGDMPKEIVDSFNGLKTGVEKLLADTTMEADKKNTNLVKVASDLKAIVDTVSPKAPETPVVDTTKVVPDKPATPATPAATDEGAKALELLTDSSNRLKEYVEKIQREADGKVKAEKLATYLVDKISKVEQADDVKKTITDTLKVRTFADEAGIDTAIAEVVRLVNSGVAQEKLRQEGIKAKGTSMMDVIVAPEHLKGAEILTDQIIGTGFLIAKKEDVLLAKGRSPMVRQLLKIYDQRYGAQLKRESDLIVSLQDATQTPADFDIPYTISRIVLSEVYADQIIERLTLFGPMEAKRDQVPITRYRREGGLAGTQKTYKPSKRRIADIKVGEFQAMQKGKLLTEWFPIDATASKLSASFSDEFITLSKRYPNITGVSQGIANLIADLKRSLQQMVFTDMKNAALARNSVAFTYNGVGDGAKTEFVVVADASISTGEALTVTVDGAAIHEYEVSTTGAMFYVVDGPNGKILFVDEDGAASAPPAKAIVVIGKKATNETRFSLSGQGTMEWEKYMNKLLFAVTNAAAAHRQERGYKPEFLLASEVTSNYMTQAQAYQALGARKNFSAAAVQGEGNYGFTGGLPHFGSDVWDDAYVLLSQKDATIFRIFEPMILKGPYPVRDTDGQLIGGDEYYIYQEDSLKTPIADKLSLVTVVT